MTNFENLLTRNIELETENLRLELEIERLKDTTNTKQNRIDYLSYKLTVANTERKNYNRLYLSNKARLEAQSKIVIEQQQDIAMYMDIILEFYLQFNNQTSDNFADMYDAAAGMLVEAGYEIDDDARAGYDGQYEMPF